MIGCGDETLGDCGDDWVKRLVGSASGCGDELVTERRDDSETIPRRAEIDAQTQPESSRHSAETTSFGDELWNSDPEMKRNDTICITSPVPDKDTSDLGEVLAQSQIL